MPLHVCKRGVSADTPRARTWDALDIEHIGEEIEDLWKHADHALTMLLLGFLELIYRPCHHEKWQCHWQSAAIDYQRAMLVKSLEDSPPRTIGTEPVPTLLHWDRVPPMVVLAG
jgi:hypothetical protein